MPAQVIADMKAEARNRKITLAKLVQELWVDHRAKRNASGKA
jgi:hypothetical protein